MHEWHRNNGSVSAGDACLALLLIAGGAAALTGLLFFLLRRRLLVAAAATVFATLIFCFWGYLYDSAKVVGGTYTSPLLLALLVGISVFLLRRFKKRSAPYQLRLARFSALLFGTLAVVDGARLLHKHLSAEKDFPPIPLTGAKQKGWSFYFLIFDELASPKAYAGMGLDIGSTANYLRQQGFYLHEEGRSNYRQTVFSMASMLNGGYIPDREHKEPVRAFDYNNCYWWINHARIPEAFIRAGYRRRNLSIFRMGGEDPETNARFFRRGVRLLFYSTFYGYVLEPRVLSFLRKRQRQRDTYHDHLRAKNKTIKILSDSSGEKEKEFYYAHFFLPHGPFYFDSSGKPLSREKSYEVTTANLLPNYLANVRYTQHTISQVVDAIMKREKGRAAILVMGDHGYRNGALPGNDTGALQAFCAIYYPDQDYRNFIGRRPTHVNVMRQVTSDILGANLPPLPDSVVLLGRDSHAQLDW